MEEGGEADELCLVAISVGAQSSAASNGKEAVEGATCETSDLSLQSQHLYFETDAVELDNDPILMESPVEYVYTLTPSDSPEERETEGVEEDGDTLLYLAGDMYVLAEGESSSKDRDYTNILQENGYMFVKENNIDGRIALIPQVSEDCESSESNDVDIETLGELVQALKCRLCQYTTLDQNQLLLHHAACHSTVMGSYEEAGQEPEDGCDEEEEELVVEEEEDEEEEGEERVMFVCSHCSAELPSVETCRQHMILQHNLAPVPQLLSGSGDGSAGTSPQSGGEVSDKEVQEEIEGDMGSSGGDQGRGKERWEQEGLRRFWLQQRIPRDLRRRLCSDWKVRCSVRKCAFRFSSVERMERHRACHVQTISTGTPATKPQPPLPFKCPECEESFPTWPACSLHLGRLHNLSLDLLLCPLCRHHSTHSAAKMVQHLSRHAEQGDPDTAEVDSAGQRWYNHKKCQICQKIYANSKSLKKHTQAVHHKLKPFKCNVCGHSSASKTMLLLHQRQHTGEKPYACAHCPYRSSDHNTRNKHQRRHTMVYAYQCKLCPYRSIQSYALASHIRNRHPVQTDTSTTGTSPPVIAAT